MSPLVIIQCRLGSTRLPQKALADIGGKPMIQRVWERAKAIRGVDDVIVAVPNLATRLALLAVGLPADKVIATPNCGEDNVLCRFATVAIPFRHDVIVRLTADNPLLDPVIAEQVLELFAASGAEYAWNDTTPNWPESSGYPDGTDVEVFTLDLLKRAHQEATDEADLEHVTPWMRRATTPSVLASDENLSAIPLTVNTAEDLERVRAIMARLPEGDYALATTLNAARAVMA